MAHLGAPIVGDTLYGAGYRTKALALPQKVCEVFMGMERQALHAVSLRFRHPATGKLLVFETALPDDIAKLCSVLEGLDAKLSKN